uniref:Tetratricopeptide repeat-containing protein n=1 Tax=Candidatus Kentrum sp. SD TaxID=2126332 RepID=A0A451BJ17_9GAMM|nr:MAG: Tetratricopeptide repeat-containing protein [Candidatus Kentron sp. SD]
MKTNWLTLILILLFALRAAAEPPTAGGGDANGISTDFLIEMVIEAFREQSGKEPSAEEIAGVLNRTTVEYLDEGNYALAEPIARRALEFGEERLGAEHPDTLTSRNNLAMAYEAQGRYGEAEPLFRRALETRELVLGPEHPDTLASRNNLALLYQKQGRYGEAEPLYQEILAASKRALGGEHPQTLTTRNNLAALYRAQGRHREAEPIYQETLAARERVLGEDHPDTLMSRNNLAMLYETQGRYREAEPLYQKTLAASEHLLGKDHPSTLNTRNNLAALYEAQGRYGEAEPLLKETLATRERALGEEHPDTLGSLNNLAVLYQAQGRYGEAEPLLQRALETRERMLGPKHPNTLTSRNNLAMLYQTQGRYEKAESLLRRVLETCERKLGEEHPDTLISRNNLALLYQKQGRYGEAEPLLQRTLAVQELRLGDEHSDTLGSRNNLALLYGAQGRYGEAEPLYKRALETSERVLGKSHPDTLNIQFNLILLNIRREKLKTALAGLREMDGRLRRFVDAQLDTTQAEKTRRGWLRSKSNFQDVVHSLALRHPGMETRRLAADVLLGWQHLAGAGEALDARIARESDDPQVREVAEDLAASRARLSHLMNLPRPDPAAIAKGITEEQERLGALEVRLAGFSKEYRKHLEARQVSWQAVRERLPAGSALLLLRAFQPLDFKTGKLGEPRWLAMLIPAEPGEGPAIRLADLGSVSDINAAIIRSDAKGPKAADQQRYASLFGQWDRELAQYERLYLAPDGTLELVPFDSLILPDGRYWVERQTLHRLRAARDLLSADPVGWAKERSDVPIMGAADEKMGTAPGGAFAQPTLIALGGIDYEKFSATGGSRPSSASGSLGVSPTTRLTMNRRLRAERGAFGVLPHTGREVSAIVRQYKRITRQPARAWYGKEADEGRLKTLLSSTAQPPRVLHLATHGFFLEKKSGEGASMTERPMTLGGLALAGANRGMAGELGPDGEDGVLYPLEAQSLNLQGTELVVLSACDTGKGEVDVSDGVYGLTRAFRIAGARNVLMTLWPLNDALAKEFMEDFYCNWLGGEKSARCQGKPLPIAEALRQTRLDWIRSDDEQRRNSMIWAPYVLVE